MLARLWHGRVPSQKADAYEAHLNRSGIPDYLATLGNRGVTVLRCASGALGLWLGPRGGRAGGSDNRQSVTLPPV
jgi:hypothetical protein